MFPLNHTEKFRIDNQNIQNFKMKDDNYLYWKIIIKAKITVRFYLLG